MEQLIIPAVPVWNVALRTAIIYAVLLVLLRVAGKRELGQMTPFDFVVILTISNAVQNAMVGPDNSLTGGVVAAGTLVLVNFVVARLGIRSMIFRSVLRGHATLLVNDGQLVTANLEHEGIDPDDVMMAMREHGVESLEQVKLAILETDGSISIVPADAKTIRTRRHVRFMRKQP